MKLRDIIAIAALIIVAVIGQIQRGTMDDPPQQRRPEPGQFRPPPPAPGPLPGAGRDLPPISPRDPGLVVDIEARQKTSSGTAFSIDRNGHWITARHVTDGCDLVVLQTGSQRYTRVRRIDQHPNADISLLSTQGGAPALAVVRPRLTVGQDGYSFGFPQGDPGDVHARIVGSRKLIARGRYNTQEPVVAWAHVRRVPDRGAHLGGISGGPWLDGRGQVIGVHVAGAPRRGRSYSTAPGSLHQLLDRTRTRLPASADASIDTRRLTPGGFPAVGDRLRETLTIAKAICLVGEKWRQRSRGS